MRELMRFNVELKKNISLINDAGVEKCPVNIVLNGINSILSCFFIPILLLIQSPEKVQRLQNQRFLCLHTL